MGKIACAISSAWASRVSDFAHASRLAGGVHDLIGLIERVERMRCPGLALTPAAMTGMNDQWRSNQSILDLPASASAFHIVSIEGVIVSELGLGLMHTLSSSRKRSGRLARPTIPGQNSYRFLTSLSR